MSLVQLVGVAIKIAAEFVNHSQKNFETFFFFFGFCINVTGGMVVVEQNEIWFWFQCEAKLAAFFS